MLIMTVCLFDLQVPQFISEEDDETESENEILCTSKPKRLRKSNKRKSYEYYCGFPRVLRFPPH